MCEAVYGSHRQRLCPVLNLHLNFVVRGVILVRSLTEFLNRSSGCLSLVHILVVLLQKVARAGWTFILA